MQHNAHDEHNARDDYAHDETLCAANEQHSSTYCSTSAARAKAIRSFPSSVLLLHSTALACCCSIWLSHGNCKIDSLVLPIRIRIPPTARKPRAQFPFKRANLYLLAKSQRTIRWRRPSTISWNLAKDEYGYSISLCASTKTTSNLESHMEC